MNAKNSQVNDVREIRSPATDSHRISMPAEVDPDDLHRVSAGRLGVLAIVLVFVACYLYGIATYGVVLGVGLGWLPSAVIAWLAALVIGFGIKRMH